MSNKIKVLIVDDSAFMRNILERMVKDHPDMEVVGKAVDGLEAIEMVKTLQPDVVTLDIEMPKMNGLEALKNIMRVNPVPVLMISSLTEKGARETILALQFGAVDFIPKSLNSSDDNIFKKAGYVQDKILTAAKSKVITNKKTEDSGLKPIDKAPMPKMSGYLKRAAFKNTAKILVIGSSTGGPKALSDVISNLNPNLNAPIVVAQHMPEGFTNVLAERMNNNYKIFVQEVKDGDLLEKGIVYIAQGGRHLRVENKMGALYAKVSEDAGESPFKPSVNVLAESVNKAVGGNCICVMLTGMGADGAKEFKNLKQAGAYVITQNEETCTVYGMPKSVVDLNASDEELAIGDIASVINTMIK